MKEKVHCGTWDGVLYPVKGRKDKIMITMSGSEGGLEHAGDSPECDCLQQAPGLSRW